MLFTSHNMSEVEEMCDRVIILNKGKIIAEDAPENLANKISESVIEVLIKDDKNVEIVFEAKQIRYKRDKNIFYVNIETKQISDFLAMLTNNKINFQDISINKPSLEDYFLKISKEASAPEEKR